MRTASLPVIKDRWRFATEHATMPLLCRQWYDGRLALYTRTPRRALRFQSSEHPPPLSQHETGICQATYIQFVRFPKNVTNQLCNQPRALGVCFVQLRLPRAHLKAVGLYQVRWPQYPVKP